jgi:hypothetical protein
MPRLNIDYNTSRLMRPHVHGWASKDLMVLHETVSPDLNGMKDIQNIARYLAAIGLWHPWNYRRRGKYRLGARSWKRYFLPGGGREYSL